MDFFQSDINLLKNNFQGDIKIVDLKIVFFFKNINTKSGNIYFLEAIFIFRGHLYKWEIFKKKIFGIYRRSLLNKFLYKLKKYFDIFF